MATSSQLRQQIQQGAWNGRFAELYGSTPQEIAAQCQRYEDLLAAFEVHYGTGRELSLYSVPGRVELCGNHTDHNNGFVMAAAVNLDIIAAVGKNDEGVMRVRSKGFGFEDRVDTADLEPRLAEKGRSDALIRGVAAGIRGLGGRVGGFDAYTMSSVLKGSGLSSSAAFEVCIASILNGEYNAGAFSPVQLAMISQKAENLFFGKPSGLMDQTACAVGGTITIDFQQPDAPLVNKENFNPDAFGLHLVVTDTRGDHADLTEDYAAIRRDMEAVAHFFGQEVLRQLSPEAFYAKIADVRTAVGDRAVLRAIHYYEECRRVQALTAAVARADIQTILALLVESGHSSFELNQNAYSPRRPQQQEIPLALALSGRLLTGSGAWRLQGGGFAGTIQAFVPKALLAAYVQALEAVFGPGACHPLRIRQAGCLQLSLA